MKSIGRACGWANASSYSSGPTRTMKSALVRPQHIAPPTMKQRPPNIFFSTTSVRFANTPRMRAASQLVPDGSLGDPSGARAVLLREIVAT